MTRPLAITLAGAALFRIAYAAQYAARSVFAGSPILDAAVYFDWARGIASGQWLPQAPFYFAPGYAYALALLFKLTSASLAAVSFVQAACGLLGIVLIHRLALLAYDRRVAAWAAVLAALYAAFPFLETKVLSATLGLLLWLVLLLSLVAAVTRPAAWRWVVAGLIGGVTSLVRPETLLMAPLVLLWMWRWGASRQGATPTAAPGEAAGARPGEEGRRRPLAGWARLGRAAPSAALLALGWAAAIAPVTIHNLRTGGGASLISSQAGLTFYQGNNPRARGLYVSLETEGFSGEPEKQAQEEEAIAARALGRPVDRAEASLYWLGRGLAFARQDPGRFAWLEAMKLLRFVSSFEYSTEYVLAMERETVWLLWLPFVPFGLLLALAIPAAARAVAPSRPAGGGGTDGPDATRSLLVLALAANLATCLIFYVSSRYRLAALPSVIVFAAATIVSLGAAYRSGRSRSGHRRSALGVVALVGAVFALSLLPIDAGAALEEANAHYNAGTVWVRRGDQPRAAAEFRQAARLDGSRFQNWFNLASSLAELGRYREAAEAYGRAASLQPNLFDAHAQQGLMLMEVGDWRGARAALERAEALRHNVFDLQIALGRVLARLGLADDALAHYDRALAMWPSSPVARQERDTLLRQRQDGSRSEAP